MGKNSTKNCRSKNKSTTSKRKIAKCIKREVGDEQEAKIVIKSIKVMLLPNNKQRTKLFQSAGVARWAYNWTLVKQQEKKEV